MHGEYNRAYLEVVLTTICGLGNLECGLGSSNVWSFFIKLKFFNCSLLSGLHNFITMQQAQSIYNAVTLSNFNYCPLA